MSDPTPPAVVTPERVECPTTRESTLRYFGIGLLLIGFGAWAAVEVFVTHKYLPGDDWYTFNAGLVYAGIPLGLVLLALGMLKLRKTFVADQEGLGYRGKEKVAWGEVRKLVLRGKGRLDVVYEHGGQEGAFKLDSWELRNFAPLVTLIEARTPGVPTETPEDAKKA